MDMINVKINGVEYSVPAGSTVLEAARYAGIDIPTLCYLKDVNEIGACRLCLVEVTGQQIKDALELGSAAYPGESGGFLQVSGLTYTINADIPSSVVKNDKSEFVKVDGA